MRDRSVIGHGGAVEQHLKRMTERRLIVDGPIDEPSCEYSELEALDTLPDGTDAGRHGPGQRIEGLPRVT